MKKNNFFVGGLYIKKNDDTRLNSYKRLYELSFIDEDMILLCDVNTKNPKYKQITIDELEKEYLSVRQFLEQATYIGLECYRNEPIIIDQKIDTTFIPDSLNEYMTIEHMSRISTYRRALMNNIYDDKEDKFICLYMTDDNMLIYEFDGLKDALEKQYGEKSKLKFINKKYMDGNWSFTGAPYEMYEDTDEIITELYTDCPKRKYKI